MRAGKALYPALSNHAAWETQAALASQAAKGWARIQAIQPMYSLVKRQAEVEILPMAAANDISVFPYSPAGGGLLRGNMPRRRAGPASPRTRCIPRATPKTGCTSWRRLRRALQAEGFHPMSAAVAWVAAIPR